MPNLYINPIFDNSTLPIKKTTHAACYDVHAYLTPEKDNVLAVKTFNSDNHSFEALLDENDSSITLHPGDRVKLPTGLQACCDPGFKIQGVPRSGSSLAFGLNLSNCVATIDADYRDELFILLTNNSNTIVTIEHQERVAQIELIELTDTNMLVGELPPTHSNREGGLGHTGK